MLGSAVIVFREVLEAALIVGIVAAATRGLAGRGRWLLLGVGAGLVGAIVIAGLAREISATFEGVGQQLLNAGILISAVMMLAGHNIWMSRHAREMIAQMRVVGAAVNEGARPLSVIAVVVGLAVLREGAEVVLFLYGLASGGASASSVLGGTLFGIVLGASVGIALYTGLAVIPARHLFAVTGWMILLLAGGLASEAARFLVQADILPALRNKLWDTSAFLDEHSLLGQLLHTLIGYTARPSGIQVAAYVATIAVIGLLMVAFRSRSSMQSGAATA